MRFRAKRRGRYRFYSIAVDKAGNTRGRRRRGPTQAAREAGSAGSSRAGRRRRRGRPRPGPRPCSPPRAARSSDSLSAVGDQVDVLHRVVVGQQAEVDAAVVAHDRDRERVVLGQEGDREDVLELAAEHVERDLRAGDVGDDQVEEPGREVDPRGLGEQGRRREVVEARDHLGAERLLRLLQLVHRRARRPPAA